MSVSIIIPTKNGSSTLRELLAGLTIQSLQADEIIVIDSGSEDDTMEIAASYGARTYSIDPGTFDHGTTRTQAGKMASGEILVFLTQDVLIASREMLDNLTAPLKNSEDICLSYAAGSHRSPY